MKVALIWYGTLAAAGAAFLFGTSMQGPALGVIYGVCVFMASNQLLGDGNE